MGAISTSSLLSSLWLITTLGIFIHLESTKAFSATFWTNHKLYSDVNRCKMLQLAYKITIEKPDGEDRAVFECSEDKYILDAAEEQGFDIPYSCRAGACSTCVGKIVSGNVDNSEQTYLDEEQLSRNYTLTCVGYPRSDCHIVYDVEDELF